MPLTGPSIEVRGPAYAEIDYSTPNDQRIPMRNVRPGSAR